MTIILSAVQQLKVTGFPLEARGNDDTFRSYLFICKQIKRQSLALNRMVFTSVLKQ